MARTKNTGRRSSDGQGLAHNVQLDPAYNNPCPSADLPDQPPWPFAAPTAQDQRGGNGGVVGWASSRRIAGGVAAASEEVVQPRRKKRKVSDSPSPQPESDEEAVSRAGRGKRPPFGLSRTLQALQSRVVALESTVQILKEKQEKLEEELRIKRKRDESVGSEWPAEPDQGGVTFVHYAAKEGKRKKLIVRKLEKAELDLEVAIDLERQADVETLLGRVARLREYLVEEEEDEED